MQYENLYLRIENAEKTQRDIPLCWLGKNTADEKKAVEDEIKRIEEASFFEVFKFAHKTK